MLAVATLKALGKFLVHCQWFLLAILKVMLWLCKCLQDLPVCQGLSSGGLWYPVETITYVQFWRTISIKLFDMSWKIPTFWCFVDFLIHFCEANNGMSQRIASVWSIFAFEAFRTINLSECFQAFHCAQNAMLLNSLNCFTLHPICYLVFSCIPLCSLFFWLLLSSPPLWAFWLVLHLSLSCSFIVSDNFLLVNNISLFNFSFIIFNTASKIFSGSGSLHHLFFSLCNSCPFPSSVASSSSFLFLSFFQSEIPNLLGRDFPVVRISVQKHCYNS
jgi:hypothetical protein